MKVAITDDHRVVREGIRYMLSDAPDIEVVAEASSGTELLALLADTQIDVVLMDVRMPEMSGLAALERVRELEPNARVLMLSMHDQPGYVKRAIELGAAGYVLKNIGRAELITALEVAAAGGTYIPPDLMEPLVADLGGKTGPIGSLSPRERQVLNSSPTETKTSRLRDTSTSRKPPSKPTSAACSHASTCHREQRPLPSASVSASSNSTTGATAVLSQMDEGS